MFSRSDTLVQGQQVLEDVHRVLVAFLDVAVYESLCLYDDCVDKALFFGLGDGFVQLGHLSQFFRRVVFLGSLTLKNAQVEIGKTYPVEIE